MIHGSGGLFMQTGELSSWKENFGELELANHGYVTLLVHYFDSTGNVNGGDREFMQKNAETWIRTLADALEYARRLPQVDSDKIALLGESLGGFLAVALAANNKQIAAVSEYGGGIPDFALVRLRSLPPTLIQHGAADILVPLKEASKLGEALEAKGVPHAMVVYQEVGHYFSPEVRRKCLTETVIFFDKYLKR
jgi:dipeptidyl aminopeptidase/acylaminoacyl peptidase